jgi:hypothetical protein
LARGRSVSVIVANKATIDEKTKRQAIAGVPEMNCSVGALRKSWAAYKIARREGFEDRCLELASEDSDDIAMYDGLVVLAF